MSISLKELKKNRLTPAEKWVLERIDGAEPETISNGNVEWWKDGNNLFTQYFNLCYLYISDKYIQSVLRGEFGLNRDEIFDLLTNLLYDYTNNGKLIVF